MVDLNRYCVVGRHSGSVEQVKTSYGCVGVCAKHRKRIEYFNSLSKKIKAAKKTALIQKQIMAQAKLEDWDLDGGVNPFFMPTRNSNIPEDSFIYAHAPFSSNPKSKFFKWLGEFGVPEKCVKAYVREETDCLPSRGRRKKYLLTVVKTRMLEGHPEYRVLQIRRLDQKGGK